KSSLLELTSLALCLYYSQDWYSWQMNVKLRCPEQWSVGILLSWLTLVTYIQFTPTHGLFIAMLEIIITNFLWFFPILLLLVVSFGFSYYMLLQNQLIFITPIESIIRSYIMLNDVGYESHMYTDATGLPIYRPITFIIYVIYASLMFILINNLLIGFAVGEIGPMMSRAKFKRSQLRIILISEYEVIMPMKLLQYFAQKNRNEVVLPHKIKWYNKPFEAMKRFFEGNKKKELCDEQSTDDSNREQLDNIAFDQEKTKEDIQKIQNDIKDIQVYMKQMNE
ncbi:unnamed protein product, partial [Didymodactylos carnosus]